MSSKPQMKKACPTVSFRRGFTLLEILLVVGIIAILAGIVIVAINPSRQLATVRNTQRVSDLKQIYNAMTQYYIDHNAYPASSTPTTLTEICNTGTKSSATTSVDGTSCGTLANLSALVPTYLVAIPVDPTATSTVGLIPTAYASPLGTGYMIMIDANNKVVLTAPLAERNQFIAIGTTTSGGAPDTLGVGLIAHWKMNENSSGGYSVADSAGTNTGTSVSHDTATMHTNSGNPPNLNGAFTFNGVNDYIAVPSTPALNFAGSQDYTISAWVKSSSATMPADWAIGKWAASKGYMIYFGGTQKIRVYADASSYESGSIYPADTNWHLVTATKSGSTAAFYIDGAPAGSGDIGAAMITADPGSGFDIGTYSNGGSGVFFNGSIDEVRVYNRPLTQSEITQLYSDGAGTETE